VPCSSPITLPRSGFGWHDERMNNGVQARSLPERRAAAMEHLRSNTNLWLATASDGRGPHLIPASFWWDGARLTTATFEDSRTLKNVQAQPKVRASVGSTSDVLMIDATAVIVAVADIDTAAAEGYARASRNDPRSVPGFVYIRLSPQRMQVWRGVVEFTGRTVMRGGMWLDDPVD
jgi:general stress protein 26